MSNNVLFGVVTDTGDEDKLGRVKVKLLSYGAEVELPWIRVLQPMGGGKGKYGTFWIPEKNDQVLILQGPGGINGMVVLGCLYEGKTNKPIFAKDNAKNDVKTLVTRGGNKLVFTDTKGKEKVELAAGPKGTDIFIEFDAKAGKLTIKSKKEIHIDAGTTALDIKAKDVTITASGNTVINAGSKNVDIKGGKITINGSSKVVIGGMVEIG